MSFLKQYIARGKRTAWRIYGNKVIILSMPNIHHRKLEIFELTGISAYLWRLLEGSIQVEKAIQLIAKKRKIEFEKIKLEATYFIKKRVKSGLFDVVVPHEE